MTEYNKLVRDKIPQIIEAQGEVPVTRVLADGEYRTALGEKLEEEVAEYRESHELSELAVILEVVYALCEADGHTLGELADAYVQKHEARGGFAKRVFLIAKKL